MKINKKTDITLDLLKDIRARYGSRSFMDIEGESYFFGFDYKIVNAICVEKYNSFIKDGGFKRLKKVLGDGLLTNEEPKHISHRKMLGQAFSPKSIDQYELNIKESVKSMLDSWQDEQVIDLKNEIMLLTYRSIMSAFFNSNMDNLFKIVKNNLSIAAEKVAIESQTDSIHLEISKKILRDICHKVVDQRINNTEQYGDFLDILINLYKDQKMSLQDIYDEATTILLSSYETTSYAICWAICYLAENSYWREMIRLDESNTLFVIQEALRLAPPVWMTERLALEDVEVDGIKIKAGTKVVLSSYISHRDENVFPDPNTFRPERWIETPENKLPDGAYFPFHLGQRICIGKKFAMMESMIAISEIIKNFDIELVNGFPKPMPILTYKFSSNLNAKVKARKSVN